MLLGLQPDRQLPRSRSSRPTLQASQPKTTARPTPCVTPPSPTSTRVPGIPGPSTSPPAWVPGRPPEAAEGQRDRVTASPEVRRTILPVPDPDLQVRPGPASHPPLRSMNPHPGVIPSELRTAGPASDRCRAGPLHPSPVQADDRPAFHGLGYSVMAALSSSPPEASRRPGQEARGASRAGAELEASVPQRATTSGSARS